VWSDRLAADHREQFEHAYGPAAALTPQRVPQHRPMPSKEAFGAFIDHHCNEYDALDVELHAVTTSETLVCRVIAPRLEPVTGPNQPARRPIDPPTTHQTN